MGEGTSLPGAITRTSFSIRTPPESGGEIPADTAADARVKKTAETRRLDDRAGFGIDINDPSRPAGSLARIARSPAAGTVPSIVSNFGVTLPVTTTRVKSPSMNTLGRQPDALGIIRTG